MAKKTKKQSKIEKKNWSLSVGFYPGILFGSRAYEEPDHLTYVLYVPFIDVALTIYT